MDAGLPADVFLLAPLQRQVATHRAPIGRRTTELRPVGRLTQPREQHRRDAQEAGRKANPPQVGYREFAIAAAHGTANPRTGDGERGRIGKLGVFHREGCHNLEMKWRQPCHPRVASDHPGRGTPSPGKEPNPKSGLADRCRQMHLTHMTTPANFNARVLRDGNWFVAFSPEFPEGNGQGLTEAEALQSLRESILLLLEDRLEDARD